MDVRRPKGDVRIAAAVEVGRSTRFTSLEALSDWLNTNQPSNLARLVYIEQTESGRNLFVRSDSDPAVMADAAAAHVVTRSLEILQGAERLAGTTTFQVQDDGHALTVTIWDVSEAPSPLELLEAILAACNTIPNEG